MKTDFKNLIQILDYYKDKEKCIKLLEQQRWGGKVCCPHCGHDKVYNTNRGYKCANKECYKKFSVTVGTIFENSKIELRYWFAGIYLITAHKKGISSHQLARDLGVTQKTAWFINHRVREMLKENSPSLLGGTVEIDTTYVGGKEKNKHGYRTQTQNKKTFIYVGNSLRKDDKTPVLGVLQRDGQLRLKKVVDSKARTVIPFMVENVCPTAFICTDEHNSFLSLAKRGYNHDKVNHKRGEYVRGLTHTNSIESAFSIFKRGIYGIYHWVSVKHLDRYCTEFAYRHNTRKITDNERFIGVLKNSERRLRYRDLIAKEPT